MTIRIICILSFSPDLIIWVMFFHIFPLFFQKLIKIFLVKNGRIHNDRNIFFLFLLLFVQLPGLFFLCLNLADEPQHAEEKYGEYV